VFLNIGDLIKEKKLYSEWDDEMNASIFDDELVADELKRIVKQCDMDGKKGLLVDFHSVGFIPKKLVDRVVAIRTDTDKLWLRLEKRGYKKSKIQENVQAEIFMESFTEAADEFGEDIVEEMSNNSIEDREAIVHRLCALLDTHS
jgi:adenylate kinase